MEPLAFARALENVRASCPLVHCITNYVTVNDCANALLACGGSPIMSDEPKDVEDITSICGGLVINIGTLNERSIEAMHVAGARAASLGHAIVLDPVGAGASALRTQTAGALLDELPVSVVRGNMSEIKALAGAAAATRGVDVNPADAVCEDNLAESARYVSTLAAKWNAIVVVTGAIDIIADAHCAFAVRNGVPTMSKITGSGCMLSCLVAAYVTANPQARIEAAVAAVAGAGLAGQLAQARMGANAGTSTFRMYFIDAISAMDAQALEQGALVEQIV